MSPKAGSPSVRTHKPSTLLWSVTAAAPFELSMVLKHLLEEEGGGAASMSRRWERRGAVETREKRGVA